MHSSCSGYEKWQRREEQHMLLFPFFQDNRPIKLLSRQQLRWSSLYMQLQCFERPGLNVQTTFADCSQTRLCRVLILVANYSSVHKLSFEPLLSFISILHQAQSAIRLEFSTPVVFVGIILTSKSSDCMFLTLASAFLHRT